MKLGVTIMYTFCNHDQTSIYKALYDVFSGLYDNNIKCI